jgi:hypothetical protein
LYQATTLVVPQIAPKVGALAVKFQDVVVIEITDGCRGSSGGAKVGKSGTSLLRDFPRCGRIAPSFARPNLLARLAFLLKTGKQRLETPQLKPHLYSTVYGTTKQLNWTSMPRDLSGLAPCFRRTSVGQYGQLQRTIVRCEDFEVNLETGEVGKAGLSDQVQDQPFRALAALLERLGQIITREELRHLFLRMAGRCSSARTNSTTLRSWS